MTDHATNDARQHLAHAQRRLAERPNDIQRKLAVEQATTRLRALEM